MPNYWDNKLKIYIHKHDWFQPTKNSLSVCLTCGKTEASYGKESK